MPPHKTKTALHRACATRKSSPRPSARLAGAETEVLRQRLAAAELALEELRSARQRVKDCPDALQFSEQGSASFYRVMLEEMNEAAVTLNQYGLIVFCNANFGRLTCREVREIIGLPFSAFVPDTEHENFARLLAASRQSGVKGELLLLASEGLFPASLAVREIRLGGEAYYSLIVSDLSESKAHALALKRALVAAESASRAKSEFLANVSHEIRTPLNGMLGMLQLLGGGELQLEQRDLLAIAEESGKDLLKIINNILDLTKAEAGTLCRDDSEFDPSLLLGEVKSFHSIEAAQKGLKLFVRIDPLVPARIVGDSAKLRQVLLNLVGNAVKFTARGEVEIRLEPDAGREFLRFSVRDTGIGIPQDKIAAIFEPFSQADTSYTRSHQGLGLGLSVVKRLLGLLGTAIKLQSEPGQGTLCSFELPLVLPLERTHKLTRKASLSCPAQGVVLLVEDDKVCQFDAKTILEKCGFTVLCACDGQEGLEILEREQVDAVLMDIQMPRMDGMMAARAIRDASRYGEKSRVPIISLTAHASQEQRRKYLEAGMDEMLSKPLRIETLLQILDRYM